MIMCLLFYNSDTATSMPPVTAKTTPSAPLAGSASGGLSSAQIAGMVIGFLGLVVLLVVVIACVKRYKGSIGLVNLEELRDTTSVTSSQGYTNTNTTSNMWSRSSREMFAIVIFNNYVTFLIVSVGNNDHDVCETIIMTTIMMIKLKCKWNNDDLCLGEDCVIKEISCYIE